MNYAKPKVTHELLMDYEEVLNTTRNQPGKVNYYAFHGVKSEVGMALAFCRRKLGEVKPEYVATLERLEEIRWSY